MALRGFFQAKLLCFFVLRKIYYPNGLLSGPWQTFHRPMSESSQNHDRLFTDPCRSLPKTMTDFSQSHVGVFTEPCRRLHRTLTDSSQSQGSYSQKRRKEDKTRSTTLLEKFNNTIILKTMLANCSHKITLILFNLLIKQLFMSEWNSRLL